MQPGDKIGRYQILGKIGQGGMGEVYLAEDVKLARRVALKVLPSSVADNVERMLRFEHEAKSASALNHPNIITIYEIDDSHDVPFIAMEYVGGETLAKRIRSGQNDLKKTLDIAIQIAGALAAAHDANVIHRDIKPDNVIIRPDGLVKVLDFGLAKLAEKPETVDIETQTTAYVLTSPGLVMGTIGYMSPEQARGKHIDARSDIFGFGTMLYQMLSGKLPFAGDNNADILAGILNKDPEPLAAARPEIPPELEALVRKMLRKDRDERYQSVRELLADLREIRDEIAPGSGSGSTYARLSDPGPAKITGNANTAPLPTGGQSGGTRNTISEFIFEEIKLHPLISAAVLFTVAAVLVTAGLSMSGYLDREPARDAFQAMRPAKLTSTGNVLIGNTAVSPEGKLIAYVTSEAGQESLWVKQTGAPTHLPLVAASNVRYRHVIFSPDSNYVYYISAEPQGVSALYQVPALGGPVRKLVADANAPISFSPSGDRIAFVRDQNTLLTATRDGTDIQTAGKLSGDRSFLLTSWKPDGSSIAAAAYFPSDSRDHLIEIDLSTGAEKPFPSPDWLRIRGLAWLPDSSGVVVSGRDPETEYSQIWMIGYPDGKAKRITNDLNNYQGLSLTADGRSAVTTQHTFLSNIWAGGAADGEGAAKITAEVGKDEGMSGVAWTPDGRIVYTTRIKGVQDIWIVNRDGSGNRQLTFNSRSNYSPRVTSDGRYIVFVSTREGGPAIWRMGIDGSDPVQLTFGPGSAINPDLTPDGAWILYQLQDADRKHSIWKVSIDGGTPVRLTSVESSRPAVSPEGSVFACEYGEPLSSPASRLAVVAIDGGEPQAVYDLPKVLRSRDYRWSPDGKGLIYFDSRDRVDNLWSQPLAGGGPVQVTNFNEDRIFRFDISTGGQYAIARGTNSADVVMLANFR